MAGAIIHKTAMKIFGKSLKQYAEPVKYYILGSVLVVISQYAVALPLSDRYPFLLNLTQALWALLVALAVVKLVKKNFGMKHLLVAGILFSFAIHGLKVSIRYFFYGRDVNYVIDRFLYGSLLVFIIVIVLGALFLYLKKKNTSLGW